MAIRYERGILEKNTCVNTIYSFDTENSTAFLNDGVLYPYDSKKSDKFYDESETFCLLYIWQFAINDTVYYGRYLEELLDFITELSQKHNFKKYVYVHNLSHDFMYLLNIIKFTPDNVFCRKPYKVVYAYTEKYNIEFRCSYFLTNLSLANWGKKIGLPKLVGELDYNLIRTPETELSEKELDYCTRDCLVIFKGIQKFFEKYGSIEKIPLTQTGEIRKEYKKRIGHNFSLLKKIRSLIPTEEEYRILKKLYRGGDTHGNYIHVNKILKNVHSWDITSSYPYSVISEKYPMTPWTKKSFVAETLKLEDVKIDGERYAYMLHARLYNVKEKHSCHYISESKCEYYKGELLDNGRILSADYIDLWINELDLEIIQNVYYIERIEFTDIYYSMKRRLPKELIIFVIELFTQKTQYKDVNGYDDIYMQAKQFLNSVYGMMVSDIINNDVTFIQDGNEKGKHYTDEKADYESSVAPYFQRLHKNFLSYSWGVWVTSYSRYNLWKAIQEIGDDVVYYDTDSVKFIGNHSDFFDDYNKKAIEKGMKAVEIYGLSTKATSPNGKECILGVYENDGEYVEFKTLGAKRYAYKKFNKESGEIETRITVSGVKKSAYTILENDLNNFRHEMKFPRDISGKTIAIRNFNQPDLIWTDYKGKQFKSNQRCGATIRKSSYNLTIDDYFLSILSRL